MNASPEEEEMCLCEFMAETTKKRLYEGKKDAGDKGIERNKTERERKRERQAERRTDKERQMRHNVNV